MDALWFDSLGYSQVFWKILGLQGLILVAAGAATFIAVYGAFLALKPARFGEIGSDGVIIINDRPVRLPVGPVLSIIAVLLAAIVALGTAVGLMSEWPTIALWWHGKDVIVSGARSVDPIFGRPIAFYLFTLPAWELAAGWLLRLAMLTFGMGLFFFLASSGTRVLQGRAVLRENAGAMRGLAVAFGFLLAAIAVEVYLGRFEHAIRGSRDLCRCDIYGGARHADRQAARGARVGRRRCRSRGDGVRFALGSAGSSLQHSPRWCSTSGQAPSALMSRASS